MENDFFEQKDGATFLKIRATTKVSKNAVGAVKNGELSVCVTAVPENGGANEAIIKILSKKLGIAKSGINIISGLKCRNKLIKIDRQFKECELLNLLGSGEGK